MVYAPVPVESDISRTALAMCAYCAFTQRHERFARVLSDQYSEQLFRRAVVDGGAILHRLKNWPDVERFIRNEADGDLVIVRHMVWRRRWIADRIDEALDAGAEQIVVFGSGMDPLALRLRERFSTDRIYEVDKPSMLSLKQRLVDEISGTPLGVRYVPLDLSQPSGAKGLLETDFDPRRRTLVLAEAVMEYLPPTVAVGMFDFIKHHTGPGSRFIFTFFSSLATDSRSQRRQSGFSEVGEPILFNMSPAMIDAFLAERGFERIGLLTPQFIRERYLDDIGMRCTEMTSDDVRDLLHICVGATHDSKSDRQAAGGNA